MSYRKKVYDGFERCVCSEWTDWDYQDHIYQFDNAKLIVDIGPYKVGDVVNLQFDMGGSVMSILDDAGQVTIERKFVLGLIENNRVNFPLTD